jgi:hypothetical protein
MGITFTDEVVIKQLWRLKYECVFLNYFVVREQCLRR